MRSRAYPFIPSYAATNIEIASGSIPMFVEKQQPTANGSKGEHNMKTKNTNVKEADYYIQLPDDHEILFDAQEILREVLQFPGVCESYIEEITNLITAISQYPNRVKIHDTIIVASVSNDDATATWSWHFCYKQGQMSIKHTVFYPADKDTEESEDETIELFEWCCKPGEKTTFTDWEVESSGGERYHNFIAHLHQIVHAEGKKRVNRFLSVQSPGE